MKSLKNLYCREWLVAASKLIFTHTFHWLLDKDYVWFCICIIKQTRTGVVTLGFKKRTDGYLIKCEAFLLFSSNTQPVRSFGVGLGAYLWRTTTDATGLDKYRSPWPLETHLLRYLFWILLYYKTTLKMSPNMTCEGLQSFSPRLTVAKRKEALELRKVREVPYFCFNILLMFFDIFHFMSWKCTKYFLFFPDYETFDGKKKARPY